MSLFVVILMWTYFVIASTSSLDVRFDDGALNLNEMYWYEAALFLVGFPLNFAFIFTALWHAWKTDRKKLFCVVSSSYAVHICDDEKSSLNKILADEL